MDEDADSSRDSSDVSNKLAVTRKRVRSDITEKDESSNVSMVEHHVFKKKSISDMDGLSSISITSTGLEPDRVALLDAGAQYGKVIDRRICELKVECVLFPLDTPASTFKEKAFRAIIISGSPNGVNDKNMLPYDPSIFSCGLPILGICYGFHLINKHFGGTIGKKKAREDGQFTVEIKTSTGCPLFTGLESKQDVLLTHGDSIANLASCLEVVGMSGNLVAAIQHKTLPIYGVQFHPEVDLTVNGRDILKNFVYTVAGCSGNFTLQSRETSCIKYIRRKVGHSKVLSLVSGGVDSAVCTALLNAALGPENVIALHIDNGFMRKDESKAVKESLEALGLHLHSVDASLRFYTSGTVISGFDEDGLMQQHVTAPLHAVTNPEEKRRIIGDTFIKIANEAMLDLDLQADKVFLAQGTLRPDLIESASNMASGNARVIKTHHNDTQLVRELRELGRVVEPLAEFHKDEVKALGESLGLPKSLVNRHPFPGPGLAIRVICQAEPFMRTDFATTNHNLNLFANFSQSYKASAPGINDLVQLLAKEEQEILFQLSESHPFSATLLPIHTVGVQGDGRTYSYVAALSSSHSEVRWKDLITVAKIIPRICHNINRVAWVFGPAIMGPIEDITPTYLTRGVLETLRICDHLVNRILTEHDAMDCVSQMPVILLPLHFDRDPNLRPPIPSCQRSVAIRTFITTDFMTGVPAIPGIDLPLEVLEEMVHALKRVSGISRILYDLTSKPPGTTEWE